MKTGIIAEIDNVKEARESIQFLINRPKEKMVGLGLWYGKPGLSKTETAKDIALNHEDCVFFRLEGSDTAKSFLQRLYSECMMEIGGSDAPPAGSTNKVFNMLVDLLQDNPLTIIIDEIDYAFSNKRILRCIRDIVDLTFAEIILIGMDDALGELKKQDAHYFDRCNYFVHFTALTQADFRHVVDTISEVKMDDDLVKHLHKVCGGTLRRLIKEIHSIEAIAKACGDTIVTGKMYRGAA